MNKVLLDSSALLVLINREKGLEAVEAFMGHAAMSSVNYAEVVSKLVEIDVPAKEAARLVSDLLQEIVPFDQDCATIAGRLRVETKALGLSLGDRACLATAERHKMEVVTADKAWSKLPTSLKIKFVR